jgi:hypothetical protein
VLEYWGKYVEAEGMLQQALELKEKALGQKYPHTLHGINNLAQVLRNQASTVNPLYKNSLGTSDL